MAYHLRSTASTPRAVAASTLMMSGQDTDLYQNADLDQGRSLPGPVGITNSGW